MEYIRFICLVGKRVGEVNKDALTIVTCNVKCQIVNSTQVAPGVKWPHPMLKDAGWTMQSGVCCPECPFFSLLRKRGRKRIHDNMVLFEIACSGRRGRGEVPDLVLRTLYSLHDRPEAKVPAKAPRYPKEPLSPHPFSLGPFYRSLRSLDDAVGVTLNPDATLDFPP